MNTVYARALVALALIALPASTLASTKGEAKAHKSKVERAKPSHGRASVAQKEHSPQKAKHPGHKAKDGKTLATADSRSNAKAH